MQTDFKKPIIIFAIMLAATMVLGIARKSIEHNNQEERLKNKLGVLGATYYQKVYLPTVNNVDELGSYTEDGMKVGLSELISAIYYASNFTLENIFPTADLWARRKARPFSRGIGGIGRHGGLKYR